MRGVDRATESGILVRHIHLIHGGDSPNETSNVSSPDIDYRSAGVGCRMLSTEGLLKKKLLHAMLVKDHTSQKEERT